MGRCENGLRTGTGWKHSCVLQAHLLPGSTPGPHAGTLTFLFNAFLMRTIFYLLLLVIEGRLATDHVVQPLGKVVQLGSGSVWANGWEYHIISTWDILSFLEAQNLFDCDHLSLLLSLGTLSSILSLNVSYVTYQACDRGLIADLSEPL